MDLMEKVRQVGENYELNKYKTLNRTIELDARLANERLLATKFRLSEMVTKNEKLAKQLQTVQQQHQSLEKRLVVSETMLRQQMLAVAAAQQSGSQSVSVGCGPAGQASGARRMFGGGGSGSKQHRPVRQQSRRVQQVAAGRQHQPQPVLSPNRTARVGSSATQTSIQTSRTKMIMQDLKQLLNLATGQSAKSAPTSPLPSDEPAAPLADAAASLGLGLASDEPATGNSKATTGKWPLSSRKRPNCADQLLKALGLAPWHIQNSGPLCPGGG